MDPRIIYHQFLSASDLFDQAVASGDHELAEMVAGEADKCVKIFEQFTRPYFWR